MPPDATFRRWPSSASTVPTCLPSEPLTSICPLIFDASTIEPPPLCCVGSAHSANGHGPRLFRLRRFAAQRVQIARDMHWLLRAVCPRDSSRDGTMIVSVGTNRGRALPLAAMALALL